MEFKKRQSEVKLNTKAQNTQKPNIIKNKNVYMYELGGGREAKTTERSQIGKFKFRMSCGTKKVKGCFYRYSCKIVLLFQMIQLSIKEKRF